MASASERRARIRGSVEVSIVGVHYERVGWSRHELYDMRVSIVGSGEEPRYVAHNYSRFASLHALLKARGGRASSVFADLPSMPPRGRAAASRRGVLEAFLAERTLRLGDLLTAMVALNPTISDPDLRQFLGDSKPNECHSFEARSDEKLFSNCNVAARDQEAMYHRVRKLVLDTAEAKGGEDFVSLLDADEDGGVGQEHHSSDLIAENSSQDEDGGTDLEAVLDFRSWDYNSSWTSATGEEPRVISARVEAI